MLPKAETEKPNGTEKPNVVVVDGGDLRPDLVAATAHNAQNDHGRA